jgi:1-deoxy-D-xylulose-5-phosphate synthase
MNNHDTEDTPRRRLDDIHAPQDLRALSVSELDVVAEEIRQEILRTVTANGGHLASPLGVVDLTLAIHYVFDTPNDLVIWDVGHQCYAHKIVTGRREAFPGIRKKDGLAGYPSRAESQYDVFGTGHSSTSISAALGMAVAAEHRGEDRRVIAVIGDGALTGGMAFEGISNAGHLGKDLLIILNDNEMSISKNVGALSTYLSRLITGGLYNRAREDFQTFLTRTVGQRFTKAVGHLEHSVKSLIMPGGLFQDLGIRYVGPVDGHDLPTLVDCLANLKSMKGPILFHCVTRKGKGYERAEQDPLAWHGVKPHDITTREVEGEARPSKEEREAPKAHTFTDAFASALINLAANDPRIIAITAAMPTGTGLSTFQEVYPDRFYDVGICEQHAVTFAAGLAAQGMIPVCAIYSTFLQRGYDQVIHDVCIQNLPVVFAIDRAGFVGEDSPTQQGAFDISFLRIIPNLALAAPRDDLDLALLLECAVSSGGPVAVRYARSKAPTIGATDARDILHGQILRPGADITLLTLGPCAANALAAAEVLQAQGVSVRVADARWIKPLDTELLDLLADTPIITVEENAIAGGFGSAVMEYFESTGRLDELRIRRLGFPDRFIQHATRDEQIIEAKLDTAGLIEAVRNMLHIDKAIPFRTAAR